MFNLSDLTQSKVVEEVRKIQYLYKLKKVIRYAETRTISDCTESVAEHVYGMNICARYFLPLEDPEGIWNKERIYDLITIHDFDEIETGDILGYLKTKEMIQDEKEAIKRVLSKAPAHLETWFSKLNDEYDAQETPEAKFVKAIDKFEPVIQIYTEEMKKVLHKNKTTNDENMRIKYPYVKDYPFLKHFTVTMQDVFEEEDYFLK